MAESLYTPEILDEICDRVAQGEPLEVICRDEHIPVTSRTIRRWLNGEVAGIPESIASDFARAKDEGYDAIAERTRLTARGDGDSTNDVQRDKLIIDTDLKLLAKWTKKYSERIDHTSSDGSMTPKTIDCSSLSNEVMAELLKAKDAAESE